MTLENAKLPGAVAEIGVERGAFWKTLQVPCWFLTKMMFDLRAYGTEHMPPTGGVLLVSNHQSNLDPVLLAVRLRRPVSFLAKAELFEDRMFGWLIRKLNAFPVRRGEGDIAAVRETIRRLQEGRILTMFPEGTRSHTGEIGPIQPGIAMIVRRAEVPVVPAVIDGAYLAWPRTRKLPQPYPIRVMYGPPLQLEGLKSHAVVGLIDRTLREMLMKLRAIKS